MKQSDSYRVYAQKLASRREGVRFPGLRSWGVAPFVGRASVLASPGFVPSVFVALACARRRPVVWRSPSGSVFASVPGVSFFLSVFCSRRASSVAWSLLRGFARGARRVAASPWGVPVRFRSFCACLASVRGPVRSSRAA